MKQFKRHINKVAHDNEVPEDVVEAAVKSIYEYIRYNSRDMVSVRIPNFGLFVVKPNRIKYLNEYKEQNRKRKVHKKDDDRNEGEGI